MLILQDTDVRRDQIRLARIRQMTASSVPQGVGQMDANPVDRHVPDILVIDSADERLVMGLLGGPVEPRPESDPRPGLSL